MTSHRLRNTNACNVRLRHRPKRVPILNLIRPRHAHSRFGIRHFLRTLNNLPIPFATKINNPSIIPVPRMRLPTNTNRNMKTTIFLLPRSPLNIMSRRPLFRHISFPTTIPHRVRMVTTVRHATRHHLRIKRPNHIRFFKRLNKSTPVPNRRAIQQRVMGYLIRRARTTNHIPNRPATTRKARLRVQQLKTMRLIRNILLRRRRQPRTNNHTNGQPITTRHSHVTILHSTTM